MVIVVAFSHNRWRLKGRRRPDGREEQTDENQEYQEVQPMTMTDAVLFVLVLVFPLLPGRCQAVLQDAMGQVAGVSPHALWQDAILKRGGRLPARETEERGLRALVWLQPFAIAYNDLRGWWPVQRRLIRRIDLYYDMEHHVWHHRNQEKPRYTEVGAGSRLT